MVVLFTDFGVNGPYLGQIRYAVARNAPSVPVLDFLADAPAFDPRAAAYLLASYVDQFETDTVFLAVVDPGVGGTRHACVVRADDRWFVGPDNGLFNVVAARASNPQWWRIHWRPKVLSATFHGRDVFAPVAGWLATDSHCLEQIATPIAAPDADWPLDSFTVIYIDSYGNVTSGIRSCVVDIQQRFLIDGHTLSYAKTFCEAATERPFWYINSNGLVEFAANRASAAHYLGCRIGDPIQLVK